VAGKQDGIVSTAVAEVDKKYDTDCKAVDCEAAMLTPRRSRRDRYGAAHHAWHEDPGSWPVIRVPSTKALKRL